MEDKDKLIDQSGLAESVAKKVPYIFWDQFLVKPLDPIKVKKEVSKMPTKPATKDENGIVAVDVEEPETEIVEVDSDFRKGVVIKVPYSYEKTKGENNLMLDITPGTVVLFRESCGMRFDLLKDSRLIRMYDILGIEE